MKSITLNECGGVDFGFIGGFGCSPDFSPITMRILYGPRDEVKRKMKKHVETTKQAFKQDRARFIWDELCHAQWNVEWAIKAYNELIAEINKKMTKIKDKEKIKVGKQAIAEMKKRIPELKKIFKAMEAINSAEIAIPYESGNKVFVV